jgi:hypothetical protein
MSRRNERYLIDKDLDSSFDESEVESERTDFVQM